MTIKFIDDLKMGAHKLLFSVSTLFSSAESQEEEQELISRMKLDLDFYSGFVQLMTKVMKSEVFNSFEFPVVKSDEDYGRMNLTQLATELKLIHTYLEECKDVQKYLQAAYDHLSIDILPERMDEEGVETMKVKDVGRLQVKGDMQCTIPAANKDAVYQWLEDNGHKSLISTSVNASTFKATIK